MLIIISTNSESKQGTEISRFKTFEYINFTKYKIFQKVDLKFEITQSYFKFTCEREFNLQ